MRMTFGSTVMRSRSTGPAPAPPPPPRGAPGGGGPTPGGGAEPSGGRVAAVIHRSPTCDCCAEHAAHLDAAGFATQQNLHADDLAAWKEAQGIPPALWSCHTTEVGGYLVEGHVPAESVRKLLEERPDVDGIALAGMPAGSPGMSGVQEGPLVIEAFVDGEPVGVFAVH
jgi:hypothetical protein